MYYIKQENWFKELKHHFYLNNEFLLHLQLTDQVERLSSTTNFKLFSCFFGQLSAFILEVTKSSYSATDFAGLIHTLHSLGGDKDATTSVNCTLYVNVLKKNETNSQLLFLSFPLPDLKLIPSLPRMRALSFSVRALSVFLNRPLQEEWGFGNRWYPKNILHPPQPATLDRG